MPPKRAKRCRVTDQMLVVQFPHPGPEHRPDTDGYIKWNTGDHARRFMKVPGRWLTETDSGSTEQSGDLVFWGEWEPPSIVVGEYPKPLPGYPRYLYEPHWSSPPKGCAQNTDPYVFGEPFLYSNCRQVTKNGVTRMQRLSVGSVILFGSRVAGDFVLDTALVVAGAQPLALDLVPHLEGIDDVFQAVVLDVLYGGRHKRRSQRLYSGATPGQRVSGMFSFLPCCPMRRTGAGLPDRSSSSPDESTQTTSAVSRRHLLLQLMRRSTRGVRWLSRCLHKGWRSGSMRRRLRVATTCSQNSASERDSTGHEHMTGLKGAMGS